MADNDYLIFQEMKPPKSGDKYYNSLFDELREKCNPSNFLASFDKDKMLIANELFNKILNTTCQKDSDLIDLRNEASEKLGIHFSTRRKVEELLKYLNPKLYTDRRPYDKNLVEQSIYFYDKIIQNQNDIIRLEDIEKEAADFILARKNEKQEPDEPVGFTTWEIMMISSLILVLVICVFCAISGMN